MPARRRWRVYFNRQGEWPMIWCIDEGDISTQIRIQRVYFEGVAAEGATILQPKPVKLAPNEPVAWFNVRGRLKIREGTAIFKR